MLNDPVVQLAQVVGSEVRQPAPLEPRPHDLDRVQVWGTRRVQTLDGTGHRYESGRGLVPLRWVFVRDQTGTHQDEYFSTTDPSPTPTVVNARYCGRWNIETTFQEARSALGLEPTRGWREKTVLRAGPCLLGLYSVVPILFHALPASKRGGAVSWPGKVTVTFSDALCAVRL